MKQELQKPGKTGVGAWRGRKVQQCIPVQEARVSTAHARYKLILRLGKVK